MPLLGQKYEMKDNGIENKFRFIIISKYLSKWKKILRIFFCVSFNNIPYLE